MFYCLESLTNSFCFEVLEALHLSNEQLIDRTYRSIYRWNYVFNALARRLFLDYDESYKIDIKPVQSGFHVIAKDFLLQYPSVVFLNIIIKY